MSLLAASAFDYVMTDPRVASAILCYGILLLFDVSWSTADVRFLGLVKFEINKLARRSH